MKDRNLKIEKNMYRWDYFLIWFIVVAINYSGKIYLQKAKEAS